MNRYPCVILRRTSAGNWKLTVFYPQTVPCPACDGGAAIWLDSENNPGECPNCDGATTLRARSVRRYRFAGTRETVIQHLESED